MLLIKFVAIVGFAMVCLGTTIAQDHPDATVTKVSAETDDSIVFQISVGKKNYSEQEDIAVNYLVQNKSRRSVYLVTAPSPLSRITEAFIVEFVDPIKGPDAHEQYDYELIKILPGKSHQGKLLIKAKVLIDNTKYNFETVAIRASFSYLFDVSNLGDCKEATYSLPCLREIYDKSKTLTAGNLLVKRKVQE